MGKKKSTKKQNGVAGKPAEKEPSEDVSENGAALQNDTLVGSENPSEDVDVNRDEESGLENQQSDPADHSATEKIDSSAESDFNEVNTTEKSAHEQSETVEQTTEEASGNNNPHIVEETLNNSSEEPQASKNTALEDPTDVHKEESQEVISLKQQIESLSTERDSHKANYENLLARLSSMRSVFSRMKESEGELERTKLSLAQVAQEKQEMTQSIDSLQTELENLNQENTRLTNDIHQRKDQESSEVEAERSKNHVLESSNKKLALQLAELKASGEEYVILLNEEKILKQNLTGEISELEERLRSMQKSSESANTERTALEAAIKSLEKEKAELLTHFEHEKESINSQKSSLEKTILENQESHRQLDATIRSLESQLQRLPLLESEVKEKQLQIGKLRHEAIILNEHLTKSLKLLKSSSSSETVDRELVSNLFISFLSLPRGDSKKFEVLQLISNFLNWDDDKQHHAGLINKASKPTSRSESFVSLWTEFLEKESTQV